LELSWIAPAIASPFVYALVTLGDKWILSGLKLRLTSFYLFVGASQLTISIGIWLTLGFSGAPFDARAAAFGGGFLWGLALFILFWALKREQMGRVIPVSQTSPVFAAILGVVILGEAVEWWGWLAVLLVVGGAVLVSAEPSQLRSGGFSRVYLFVFGGAGFIGLAQVLLKVSAEDMDVWHNMALRGLGLFASLGLPFVRPSVVRDLASFLSNRRLALPILLTEGIGPFVGNALLLLALANGPVSLVSALLGTRPIFVLLLTLLLAPFARRVLAEKLSRADILTKAGASIAVVGGVAIISLA
jgi:drug/metabolite transporter (DMT)-like permease